MLVRNNQYIIQKNDGSIAYNLIFTGTKEILGKQFLSFTEKINMYRLVDTETGEIFEDKDKSKIIPKGKMENLKQEPFIEERERVLNISYIADIAEQREADEMRIQNIDSIGKYF